MRTDLNVDGETEPAGDNPKRPLTASSVGSEPEVAFAATDGRQGVTHPSSTQPYSHPASGIPPSALEQLHHGGGSWSVTGSFDGRSSFSFSESSTSTESGSRLNSLSSIGSVSVSSGHTHHPHQGHYAQYQPPHQPHALSQASSFTYPHAQAAESQEVVLPTPPPGGAPLQRPGTSGSASGSAHRPGTAGSLASGSAGPVFGLSPSTGLPPGGSGSTTSLIGVASSARPTTGGSLSSIRHVLEGEDDDGASPRAVQTHGAPPPYGAPHLDRQQRSSNGFAYATPVDHPHPYSPYANHPEQHRHEHLVPVGLYSPTAVDPLVSRRSGPSLAEEGYAATHWQASGSSQPSSSAQRFVRPEPAVAVADDAPPDEVSHWGADPAYTAPVVRRPFAPTPASYEYAPGYPSQYEFQQTAGAYPAPHSYAAMQQQQQQQQLHEQHQREAHERQQQQREQQHAQQRQIQALAADSRHRQHTQYQQHWASASASASSTPSSAAPAPRVFAPLPQQSAGRLSAGEAYVQRLQAHDDYTRRASMPVRLPSGGGGTGPQADGRGSIADSEPRRGSLPGRTTHDLWTQHQHHLQHHSIQHPQRRGSIASSVASGFATIDEDSYSASVAPHPQEAFYPAPPIARQAPYETVFQIGESDPPAPPPPVPNDPQAPESGALDWSPAGPHTGRRGSVQQAHMHQAPQWPEESVNAIDAVSSHPTGAAVDRRRSQGSTVAGPSIIGDAPVQMPYQPPLAASSHRHVQAELSSYTFTPQPPTPSHAPTPAPNVGERYHSAASAPYALQPTGLSQDGYPHHAPVGPQQQRGSWPQTSSDQGLVHGSPGSITGPSAQGWNGFARPHPYVSSQPQQLPPSLPPHQHFKPRPLHHHPAPPPHHLGRSTALPPYRRESIGAPPFARSAGSAAAGAFPSDVGNSAGRRASESALTPLFYYSSSSGPAPPATFPLATAPPERPSESEIAGPSHVSDAGPPVPNLVDERLGASDAASLSAPPPTERPSKRHAGKVSKGKSVSSGGSGIMRTRETASWKEARYDCLICGKKFNRPSSLKVRPPVD